MSLRETADARRRPIVFVVTGPSGSGQGTVLGRTLRPGRGLRWASITSGAILMLAGGLLWRARPLFVELPPLPSAGPSKRGQRCPPTTSRVPR